MLESRKLSRLIKLGTIPFIINFVGSLIVASLLLIYKQRHIQSPAYINSTISLCDNGQTPIKSMIFFYFERIESASKFLANDLSFYSFALY